MKPVVAILPLYDIERNSYWMIPGYMDGVLEAGGIPAMLPLTTDEAMLAQIADTYDGFLFPGGQDVSPDFYGQEASPLCEEFVRPLDVMSKLLFNAVIKTDKPIFGICRGHQLLNILTGGDLYQDLPTQTASTVRHSMEPPYDRAVHEVQIVADSPLHKLLGKDRIGVNSYHHQGIHHLGKGLSVMATAPDGLVEAVYMPAKPFVWSVQWHPEFSHVTDDNSKKLFKTFVEHCVKTTNPNICIPL